jgi:hypothetical protein
MEAWLHGAAPDAVVPALKDLLEGLSVAPAADVCALHVCVAAAPVGEDNAPAELYLTRDVAVPGSLWYAARVCLRTHTIPHSTPRCAHAPCSA